MDNQNIKQYKFIELDGIKLFVMRSGLIYRYVRDKHWKFVEKKKIVLLVIIIFLSIVKIYIGIV